MRVIQPYASTIIISRLVWNVKREFSTIATFVWGKEARAGRLVATAVLNAITWSRLLRKHAPYKRWRFAQRGTGVR